MVYAPNIDQLCIVVTCFDELQPGFMDFSYRIQSLAKHYHLVILSQHTITQPELMVEGAVYQVLPHHGGKRGWFHYLIKCAQYIRQSKPDRTVLLHSALAPLTLLIRPLPSWLYWNEHPSNLMHLPSPIKAPLKFAITKLAHGIIFHGARHAKLVMPIGEHHADALLEKGISPTRLKRIYMGVSEEFIAADSHRLAKTDEPLNLIYVGTVSESRGLDVMLEAMHLTQKNLNTPIRLIIVGVDAQDQIAIQNRIKQLGISSIVELHGRKPGSEIPNFLRLADVALCLWQPNPWNYFNPPTKLFEYLVAGLPVLASNIRTHTAYVQDGQNGWIFEYSPLDLANKIAQIWAQKNDLPNMRLRAAASGKQYLWQRLEEDFITSVKGCMA